ncbi:MAG: thiamine-phosphate kinase [Candidatus Diapherotrites archaeon]
MNLKEFGGEKAMIAFLKKNFASKDKNVIKGIGDDAAVIKKDSKGKEVFVVTTDMLCEDDHFSLKYFTPFQIGLKSMESNVSDIASMNAIPKYAFLSVAFKKNTTAKFFKEFFEGVKKSCKRNKTELIGGDITHGKKIAVSITIIGEAKRKEIVYRKGTKSGELIFVSGKLGDSKAGLGCFRKKIKGFNYVKKKHLEPKARTDISKAIGKIATAMEDVSDGLASEVKNICGESNCGAVIYWEKIPVSKECEKTAERFNTNGKNYALFGGEDFELVFTVKKKDKKKAEKLGFCVGEIIKGKKVFLERNEKKIELTKTGFDHFKN